MLESRVMTDMFVSLGTWNWLIFGFVLMALEVLAPGIFLFWLGLAALLVGLISFTVAVSWQVQLVMFAVFAAAAVPVWRRLARPKAVRPLTRPHKDDGFAAVCGLPLPQGERERCRGERPGFCEQTYR